MWRLKSQALSRPVIESIHDVVHLLLRQGIQRPALGHILANQPVGILVEPALPRMVRMREIHRRLQRLADGRMVGKLLAVVGGNRLGMRLMRPVFSRWTIPSLTC